MNEAIDHELQDKLDRAITFDIDYCVTQLSLLMGYRQRLAEDIKESNEPQQLILLFYHVNEQIKKLLVL